MRPANGETAGVPGVAESRTAGDAPGSPAVDHVRLNWREAGEGRPLVLLHGFPFNSMQWQPQLESPPDGWHVIAPDLRGFGASSAGGTGPYTMDIFAADVAALLDSLDVPEAVFCGLSMGGYVALAFLRAFPQRVRGLVLCDTRAAADSADARAGRHALAEKVGTDGAAAVRDAMLPKLVSDTTRRENPELVERIGDMINIASTDTLQRALLGMAERPDSEPLLRQIEVPTLVIVGADDAITPPGDAQMLARGIRGARIETIADAGHVSNLEQPDRFNRALTDFLQAAFDSQRVRFSI
jgi:3-oxoadipate enol-lactonase